MDKLFRQVSVKDRLPEKEGKYHTNVGLVYYHGKEFYHWIKWWLEEVKPPSDDEIIESIPHYRFDLSLDSAYKDGYRMGANYILNTLKGEKR